MPLNLDAFRNVAASAWITSRDIALEGQGDQATARLGNYVFSQGDAANMATMAAFKAALEGEFGVFGTHAFDSVVGARAQLRKSLRASDVKAVLSQLETIKRVRFESEIDRQLDTNPKFRSLPRELRATIRNDVADAPFEGANVAGCKTPGDIARLATERIDRSIDKNRDWEKDKEIQLGDRRQVETAARPDEPTGLRNLKTVLGTRATSIEDRVRSGMLGSGMRLNRSSSNPILFEKLKTNGVEPGFLYRNDWSTDDTRGFMADFRSPENVQALEALKARDPALAERCNGKPLRDQVMLAGRAHPAAMAAVSEMLLEEAAQIAAGRMDAERAPACVRALADAVRRHFMNPGDLQALANLGERPVGRALLDEAKKHLFAPIRDAVLGIRPGDAEYGRSPVFKHFSDRSIVKLDYNEGAKFRNGGSAHAGSFMRPERVLVGRPYGKLFRFFTRTSADQASVCAVSEALANDLGRIAGIPSQELQILRGRYSDGHPKLMVTAKLAAGYRDFENGMIKDGRIVPPPGAPADYRQEPLGRFKAFFLMTADRDAVGSHGQNKGFVGGRFFSIDPGHSLEGNGPALEISDDLSFKDTAASSYEKRFLNFSVFDDDTRFGKFEGVLKMRELQRSGAVARLFADYRAAFDPDAPDIDAAERSLRRKIVADIEKKETEFTQSLAKLSKVFSMQLEFYDALQGAEPAVKQGAIENLGNLEKLTSPTTWVSAQGQVALKHLEVLPESRVRWSAGVDGDNLVYHTDTPLSWETQQLLATAAAGAGARFETDAMGVSRFIVPRASAERVFAAFTEDKIAQLTHPEEYMARAEGGDPLAAAKTYRPVPYTKPGRNPQPPLTAAQLPADLDVEVEGTVVRMPKIHYETMATTRSSVSRPRTVGDLRAFMFARIRRGNEVLRALLAGNVSRFPPTRENIVALTIALHADALKKGEFMHRGAFSVADPDGHIARWLDRADGLYERSSTHGLPYQKMRVDGHLNMPRGYDVPEGMGGLLNGMRTLQYFTIPDEEHLERDRGSGPRRRLFIKCETYGSFLSTAVFHPFKKAEGIGEEMKTRSYQLGDICESIVHGASLIGSFFRSNDAEGIRKENLPEPLKVSIREAADVMRREGFPAVAEHALSGNVLHGGGVRMFIRQLQEGIAQIESPEEMLRAMRIAGPKLEQINLVLRSLNGSAVSRMGNEIMLGPDDFR